VNCLTLCLLIMLATILPSTRSWGAGADLKPPQVTVDFIFPPSPLIQYGAPRLVYEMVITNYLPMGYTLESVIIDSGEQRFSYSGETLFHPCAGGWQTHAKLSRTLYAGVTNNLERRIAEHKERRPGSFTARYNIDRLVYFEEFNDINQAISRESEIKQMARRTKIALIESTTEEWRDLTAE